VLNAIGGSQNFCREIGLIGKKRAYKKGVPSTCHVPVSHSHLSVLEAFSRQKEGILTGKFQGNPLSPNRDVPAEKNFDFGSKKGVSDPQKIAPEPQKNRAQQAIFGKKDALGKGREKSSKTSQFYACPSKIAKNYRKPRQKRHENQEKFARYSADDERPKFDRAA
jgi:hypothetical protein